MTTRTKSLVVRWFVLPLAALLLAWPALLNRYPLLYPDSLGYLIDGRATAAAIFLHRLANFTAMRSELYSLGIFLFHLNLTPWPIVALNALLTAWILRLTARSLAPQLTPPAFLAIVGTLSLFTSISWFVSLPMPDILGALLYLAIYLLVFAPETLTRTERTTLTLLAIWFTTAHSTHLMLAVGIVILLTTLRVLRWPPLIPRTLALARIAVIILAAALAQTALHAYLYGHPSLDGKRPPYLMARIIADGPGAQYLRTNCPTLHWAICEDVAHLPDNDDDFLWGDSGIWTTASPDKQHRLLAEELPLVRATLRAYPLAQLRISLANFIHQLDDFGVNDFDNNTWMQQTLPTALADAHAYQHTLQVRDAVPSNAFTILQRWAMLAFILIAAASLPALKHSARGGYVARLQGLALILIPTLLANAFLTAVLSSSDSRYQARIVWLLPLFAILAALNHPIFTRRAQSGGTLAE